MSHNCRLKVIVGHTRPESPTPPEEGGMGHPSYAQAFGRVEWVLSFTLPSDESLGFLLPSRGAGLAPRLAQKKGEPRAPGRLLRPCSGFRLPASPGHPEKPHICQKKANMGHGICEPPAGLYRGSEARPYGHAQNLNTAPPFKSFRLCPTIAD